MTDKLAKRKRGKELLQTIRETMEWGRQFVKEREWRFAVGVRAIAEFCDDRHWEDMGFSSSRDWMASVADEFDLKLSSMWNAYWVGSRLSPHMDEATMKGIGRSKLYILAGATRANDGPPPKDLVEHAKKMGVEEFRASIKRPLLTGETKEDLDLALVEAFWVCREDREFIEAVLETARVRLGTQSRGEALVKCMDIANAEWGLHSPEAQSA